VNKTNKITVAPDKGHFQGELYVGPLVPLPDEEMTPAAPVGGQFVVGHSETGHHHIVSAEERVRLLETRDPLVCYLVAEGAYADLVHQRDHDTHPTLALAFDPGATPGMGRKVVRQRETSPAGWVRAAD